MTVGLMLSRRHGYDNDPQLTPDGHLLDAREGRRIDLAQR